MASKEARPYLRALWPIVALIIAIAAFAQAATGRELADILQAMRHSHGPAAALVIAYWFRVEIRALLGRVRNRIVHGHDGEDAEVAHAIDSGTRLLRLLLRVPPEVSG